MDKPIIHQTNAAYWDTHGNDHLGAVTDKRFLDILFYLKPGGHFVFSWSHTIHKCVALRDDGLYVTKSYFDQVYHPCRLTSRSCGYN